MSEKDIRKLEEIARRQLEKGLSKEEAIRSLQQAGILNNQGNSFTSPYKNLEKAIREKQG